ncbi:MAG: Enoyl-CoA hydratase/carnithine racemase [Candidatus Alkanophagales archaeon MCA70_species_2]|nr:Enoyl-CoA hydratase/carnithine racemase [Candidatus Alkanophaga liquidiphilum]RLG36451.1 MAG: enoyl-CoA hydratase [Candidatus Alkanophagales archaeon]
MDYEAITYEKEGEGIAVITLNRPEKLNALSIKMTEELDDALSHAETDTDVRAVVLTGAGRAFSSGYDLEEMKAYPFDMPEEIWQFERKKDFERMLHVWNCEKPTVAAVNGYAIAAGFILASMCDIVIAAENAKFGMPVVRLVAAADAEVSFLPWLVGVRKAKELLFLGEMFDAKEAERIGLVNKVVPPDRVLEEAKEVAKKIAEAPPFAIRLVKASINRTLDIMGFTAALKAHFDTHILSHATREAKAFQTNIKEKGVKAAPYKR